MKRKLFAVAMLCALSFYSCNTENLIVENGESADANLTIPTDSKIVSVSDENARVALHVTNEVKEDLLIRKFALSLAKSLNKKEVRSYLKTEASKQFDGDYDILFSNQKATILGKKAFQDILFASGDLNFSDLEDLIKISPKLNIAIPINFEKWNSDSQAPVVTYLGSDYEENVTKTLLGFDYNGHKYNIDAIEEPNVPVIVIGMNERVDDDYNVRKGFLQNFGADIVIKAVNAKTMACTTPFRTNRTWERLHQVNMNVKAYEGWAKGKAELKFKCFAPTSSSPAGFTSNFYSTDEINVYRDQSNEWINREFAMFLWDNSTYTGSVMFYFYEYEGNGKSVEITVGDSYKQKDGENTITAQAKFTIQKADKEIGRFVVDQLACPPYSDADRSYYRINTNFAFATKSFN